ncbi:MAG: transglycosylase SLT domain-containing protein [Francisellaceae bacterium]|jgi:soluble lytic murein transglycosylase|nr:transglycosylase SLT domain-containing protein [Francisellaceae bacterium]MBT6538619.1 transglycosylase SLT domain-containing protein [Francisellaceae bacterium]
MNTYIKALIILLCTSIPSISHANKIEEQRELFVKIYDELKSGNINNYTQSRHKLNNYILKPYLDYLYLLNKVDDLRGKDLRAFIKGHSSWPFVSHLSSTFITNKAKSGHWKDVEYLYEEASNTSINCYGLIAQHMNNRKEWVKPALKIWLNGQSQPSACDNLFTLLENEGYLKSTYIWKRIKLAFDEDNISLAHYLAKKLPLQEQELVKYWARAHTNPKLIYSFDFSQIKHPATIEIVVHAITKLAAKDTREAVSIWRDVSNKYTFNHRHWSTVVRAIAIALAIEQHPQSSTWLDKVPRRYITSTVAQLKLQVALRDYNWNSILETVDELGEQEQLNEKWLYWKSIALDMTGKRKESQKILLSLSHTRSYYGFMASKKVLRPYAITSQSLDISLSTFESVNSNHHIQRALEWQVLEKEHNANQEWFKFLRGATEIERHAAAAIAAKENLANWAILALANAEDKNNLELRFPRKYSQQIHSQAQYSHIDPAWIFAVARQESAFISKASSSAGALGLMQIIPSTAKMVAKEHQVTYKNKKDLFDANTNISLGSKYLRMLLDDYNQNQILATASYNAGPSRVRKWLPKQNMPADIWIEIIPYSETRNYVQNVIAYTIIYQKLLGNSSDALKNLSYIPAKNIQLADN